MRYNNAAITTSTDSIVRPANIVTTFVFDWTYWQFVWHGLDSNTTYSNMSATEANTWTATSARTISASVLKWAIQTHAPVQSVNWQTWAVTLTIPTVNNATLTIQKNWTNVQTFTANQSTNATANITVPTDTADLTNWAWYLTSSTWVTTVNGNHWAVTVNWFNPWWTATTGYVVTKTASWYEWQAPSGWIEVDANSPIQLTKIRAWTQAQYDALSSYDSTTVYLTI
jgi:hypothetical protein